MELFLSPAAMATKAIQSGVGQRACILPFEHLGSAANFPKSKKEKQAEVSVKPILGFKDELGSIKGLYCDYDFLAPQLENFVMSIVLD